MAKISLSFKVDLCGCYLTDYLDFGDFQKYLEKMLNQRLDCSLVSETAPPEPLEHRAIEGEDAVDRSLGPQHSSA